MDSDRLRLRATFDAAAGRYQDARPDYPGELYEELIRLAALAPGSRLLEIGCATGKATLPLARRGYPITCLEIGPALAAAARRTLAPFPAVEVVNTSFEEWQPERESPFDLRLLDTFSGHIAMAQWQRDRLYGEIRRRLGERPGGRVRRGWGAVLHVARRRDAPGS